MTGLPSRLGAACIAVLLLGLGSPSYGFAAGLSAETTFSVDGVSEVRPSPKGTWVTAFAVHGDRRGLLVRHASSGAMEPVIAAEEPILDYRWIDDDSLIVVFDVGPSRAHVLVDLELRNGQIAAFSSRTSSRGHLVDSIPAVEDELLWATVEPNATHLHRLTTSELLEQGKRKTSRGREVRLGRSVLEIQGIAHAWVTDGHGEPQVVVRPSRDGSEILIGRRWRLGGAFDTVYRYDADDDERALRPVALVPETRRFYVVGHAGQDTIGLHEFDPDERSVVREVFRRDDVDVSGVVVDPKTGDPIAVEAMVEGERFSYYLEAFANRYASELEKLSKRLPVESIRIRDVSPEASSFLLHQRDAREPGRFLRYDVATDSIATIGLWRSDVDRERLSEVESFRVRSRDGLEIEAYLTIPDSGRGPHPLVVMPHGGPHGVRDSRFYDPRVQYLASWGFAVLQPNYRGSAGYGREYLEAIKKQWARAIEDDIDAAVEHAIARPEIDGDRICIVGGSYGGFSALASIVRHGDRYRCAVSVNGVSDIPLLYDSSDMADSKRVMDFYEEYVGDIETERGMLEAASPVYHVEEIRTPVLFIYGDRDRRVDPDHSHRMMLMMDLLDKPYEALEIEGMRHGPTPIQWVIVMRSMRRMLTKHLLPGEPFVPDPEIGLEGLGRLKHRFDLDL